MNILDFDLYRDLLQEKSGMALTQDKNYLLESRLTPLAKEYGLNTLDELTAVLRGIAPDPKLVTAVVEAMTTNETSFFRDMRPFDLFKDTVIEYMKNSRSTTKKIRIWCAAAASGQEPYTLSIILKELSAQMPGWSFDILATDISHDVLDLARRGVYSQFEVQRGMPITLLMKYFTQVDDVWHINDDVKTSIKYDYFNLLDSMTRLGQFDIIFCRNVLIYFDKDTKGLVFDKMAKQLAPDGFLFLGGAETVIGITDSFKAMPDKRGLYVRSDGVHLEQPKSTGTQALA